MPTPDCFSVLDVVAIRLARLGPSGAPVYGAGNGLLSSAQVKIDVDFDMAKGDDLEQKNGTGRICGAFTDVDRLKHIILTMDLCQLDAQLLELLTTSTVFTSGGNPIGGMVPAVGADPNNGVCFEVWTKAWDGGAQAIPAFTSPNVAYQHWVFPKATWWYQKFTLQHGFTVIPVQGKAEENPAMPAHGPYNDWPTAIVAAGGVRRCAGWFYDSVLPSVGCGYVNTGPAAS